MENTPNNSEGEPESRNVNAGQRELLENQFRHRHNPVGIDGIAEYYSERLASIESGLHTWMVGDLNDPEGRLYELYANRKLYGFVQEHFELGTSRAYFYKNSSPVEIKTPTGMLGDAIVTLLKHYTSRDS